MGCQSKKELTAVLYVEQLPNELVRFLDYINLTHRDF
jgi:hypothetical protein